MLGGTTGEITAGGTMTSTGETKGLAAIDSVRLTGLENGAGVIIIFDVFVEGDGNAAESVDDLDE